MSEEASDPEVRVVQLEELYGDLLRKTLLLIEAVEILVDAKDRAVLDHNDSRWTDVRWALKKAKL